LLVAATAALASAGQEARLAFDDLLAASQPRDVRVASLNAFSIGFPAERGPVLAALARDPDRVVQQKAMALQEALR